MKNEDKITFLKTLIEDLNSSKLDLKLKIITIKDNHLEFLESLKFDITEVKNQVSNFVNSDDQLLNEIFLASRIKRVQRIYEDWISELE